MYPKQPGASYLHDFFGNATTNPFSAYAGISPAARTVRSREIRQRLWAPALLRKHGTRILRPTQNGSQVRGEAGR